MKITFKPTALLLLVLLYLMSERALAQEYNRSAGVRLASETSAITYKKFVSEDQAVELLLSGRNQGLQLTVLTQKYIPMRVGTLDNFYFYAGMGGHGGYEKNDRIEKAVISPTSTNYNYIEENYFAIGVDGVVGIEYRILSVPLSINVDLKPYLSYIGFAKLEGDFWDGSIGIKYIF
ncbi:hypothetical protein [Reichenbachiella ulvae]|uniref:Outer membrane protein beta-barrel domain-containing protein n=1 Tax=Reichenbachiella ulvae TaxID=2980104 RepID=A0ABT3CYJ0_9BACT|nr:hypothetical protein [Reichenbachiella ulvae]MCV9388687.1 hypothetical protein [Reichenbachiella ulvae]